MPFARSSEGRKTAHPQAVRPGDALPGENSAMTSTKVWIVVYPQFQLLDAMGPAQVFASANDVMQDAAAAGDCAPLYDISLVSPGGGVVESNAGLSVVTNPMPDPAQLAGSTIVVAGARCREVVIAPPGLSSWLAESIRYVKRCCSVCTGAFLLAEAGLLDEKEAVTHWMDARDLRRYYPRVLVHDDPIFVKQGNVYTSAGMAAGIDLSLALVEEDAGNRIALNVAKRLVVFFKRPGGQRQFSSELLGQFTEGGIVPQLLKWLKRHFRDRVGVKQMATAMAMSPRALHRKVVEEAQTTPGKLLVQVRLERACLLLETSSAPLKQIASQAGFGTVYNLRRCFKQGLGVLPGDYRRKFSGSE